MKFFDKWFYRKARWCWHRAGSVYPDLKAEQDFLDEAAKGSNQKGRAIYIGEDAVVSDQSTGIELERPIRFNVASAEGGMIVEVTTYDQKNDRRVTKHHIIPNDVDDKAAAIAKIVTIEFLRRPQ